MSSTNVELSESTPSDDRTTKARIRDAAIGCFAEYGIAATTVRKVAEAASVSPGLVIHHFGSMDGLRNTCDEYVVSVIRQQKREVMSSGPGLDVLAALRTAEFDALLGYLARVLVDDSDAVAKLVDDLVHDAEGYIRDGVDAGMLRPSSDPRSRAVILMMWSLGALVLHRHLERLLGVDITNPNFGNDTASTSYAAAVFDIYGGGLLTESFAANARQAFSDVGGHDPEHSQPLLDEGSSSSPTETERST